MVLVLELSLKRYNGLRQFIKVTIKRYKYSRESIRKNSKWYFLNDPKWSMLVDNAWLWDEWPERWRPDSGIDQYL